jgi:hypothetical protein
MFKSLREARGDETIPHFLEISVRCIVWWYAGNDKGGGELSRNQSLNVFDFRRTYVSDKCPVWWAEVD